VDGPNQVVKVWQFIAANKPDAGFDSESDDTVTDPWRYEAN